MSIEDLKCAVDEMVEKFIDDEMRRGDLTLASTVIDRRSCSEFFWNDDCIAVRAPQARTLNYYGGFEYVASEYVTVLGDYVFYSAEDDGGRVQNLIDSQVESQEDEDEA